MSQQHGRLRRFLTRSLWVVDLSRRLVLNGLFVLVALLLFVALMSGGTRVPQDAVLVVDPRGEIVEQLSGSPAQRARARLAGNPLRETLLKDVLDAIRQAKDDKRIKVLLLDVDGFSGAGLTKLQDLRAAVRDFKKSGKRVVAAADGYNQSQYYLAATADEVFLHEAGLLLIEGYGRFPTFYKEGIDKLEADWNGLLQRYRDAHPEDARAGPLCRPRRLEHPNPSRRASPDPDGGQAARKSGGHLGPGPGRSGAWPFDLCRGPADRGWHR